jgi:hypothetical protein
MGMGFVIGKHFETVDQAERFVNWITKEGQQAWHSWSNSKEANKFDIINVYEMTIFEDTEKNITVGI